MTIQLGEFRDLPRDQLKNTYLQRYAWPGPILQNEPKNNTELIVVIPCFNEPNAIGSLTSLYNCDLPECQIEVIIVVNHAVDEAVELKKVNADTLGLINEWIASHHKKDFSVFTIEATDLPIKHAGVGLARKIGMDEAVRRFDFVNNNKGIIVCYDADCQCSPNYLKEIYQYYKTHTETNAALVYFEHPLDGNFDDKIYEGIINYELHLRYYKNALRFAELPYCFHTVGSCITVTSEAYQKQGGMNKRKAGEDFYFIQKIFALGPISEINTATVIPSPRPSDRVPFGTGKAIGSILKTGNSNYLTYNPQSFVDLRLFARKVPELYHEDNFESILIELPISIQNYLNTIQFSDHLNKIKNNCSSETQFLKSFYNWFNAFMTLKYVHFSRDNFYKEIEVLDAASWILKELCIADPQIKDKKQTLLQLRDLDRLRQRE